MRLAGLFAGIGGIELGFHRALGDAVETVMLCEFWEPAQRVLRERFPGVEIHPDVRTLRDLPGGLDAVTLGFPCTNLSQAGLTAGISGPESGLVAHVFDALRLAETRGYRIPWLIVENVPNMLALDKGQAMAYLTAELEALGYRWAYRVVDSRFTGVPQRRRRVALVASRTDDPRAVLFADDAGGLPVESLRSDAFGFYWTEGRGGLGWAQDAVPTIKGGSAVGIPSPPAFWLPGGTLGRAVMTPAMEDAEALQGFPRGWTAPADTGTRNGPRWKLTGNAVTVGVAEWLASRLDSPGHYAGESTPWSGTGAWPTAAWGESGRVHAVAVSEFPRLAPYTHLTDLLDLDRAVPLSIRATRGFWSRLQSGNLGRHPGFREAVEAHLEHTSGLLAA